MLAWIFDFPLELLLKRGKRCTRTSGVIADVSLRKHYMGFNSCSHGSRNLLQFRSTSLRDRRHKSPRTSRSTRSRRTVVRCGRHRRSEHQAASRTSTGPVSTLVFSPDAWHAQLVSDEAKFNGDTAFEHTSPHELITRTHADYGQGGDVGGTISCWRYGSSWVT